MLGPGVATAAERAASENVVTVSPIVIERGKLAPGDVTIVDVLVQNQTDRDFRFATLLRDIGPPTDPDKDKRILTAGSATRGAGRWLRIVDADKAYSLAAGAERTLHVSVQVPQDAAPGGHYAAILVRTLPSDDQGVQITADAAVLVLLRVDEGKIRHDLRIRAVPVRRWLWSGPTRWRVEVDNRGNVHERFGGRLVVDGMLGGPRTLSLEPMIVLPGALRRERATIEARNAPDLLRGSVRYIRNDDKLRTSAASPFVVLLPWWVLVVLVVVAAMVAWRVAQRRRAWPDDDEGGDTYDDDLTDDGT